MAITDIIEESEMIETGAPSIKYEGERPLKKQEMLMAGPDWYIKRMQVLMDEYGYDYDEAGEIAYDSDKYYEVIGIDPGGIGDESRNMDEEVVEEEGIMRAANGGVASQGGGLNYNPSKMVSVPTEFRARKNSPNTKLAYITDDEAGILKALKPDTPHKGPEGIPNYDSFDISGGYTSGRDIDDSTGQARNSNQRFSGGNEQQERETRERNLRNLKAAETQTKENVETWQKEAKEKTPFVSPTRKALYSVLPNNPANELRYINHLKTNNLAAYNKLPPELRDRYEETMEGGDMDTRSYKDFDKFSFDDFESLRNFQPTDGMNFAEYAATYAGSPGLLYSGNVGNLEKFVTEYTIHPVTGKKIPAKYGYKEKTGGGSDEPEWRRLGYSSQQDYDNRGGGSGGGGGGSDDDDEDDWYMPLAFRAEGGRVGRAYGGIMGDDGRRAYGLGSIFKKVKKIFKSPVAKAALLGLGGYKMGLFGGGKNFKLMDMVMSKDGKGGLFNWAKNNPFGAIAGASALSGLMAAKNYKKYDDWNNEDDGTGLGDLDQYRNYYNQQRAFRAEGGDAESGLMNMGGMEKDYREDGGFVPIGGKEKADDVPARLSKNEFVFTADAVRGAGEGDIDKGAEVMYNMMKNLEAGGEVSEESQGLDGAREMFETSQRLEEVL